MCFLLVNLYEFGQFLRIFLWISLPLMTMAMLVTTYFHYRRKREQQDGVLYYVDGYGLSAGDRAPELSGEKWEMAALVSGETTALVSGETAAPIPGETAAPIPGETAAPVTTDRAADDPLADYPSDIHNENMYRGILWMKEKYEQYRDLADKRYEDLREELDRTEKRYQDLLATLEDNRVKGVDGGVAAAVGTNGMPVATGHNTAVGDGGKGDAEAIALLPGSDMERESMRDIVEEKNRQIDFLQHQLEQRIKNYHQMEYQGRDYKVRIEELENQSEAAQQALGERQHTIDQQNGRLDAMEESLQIERSKVEELVAKLQANSLLLMNIYKELDKSLKVERTVEDAV